MKPRNTILMIAFVLAWGLNTVAQSQVLWYGNPNKTVRQVFRRLDPDGNKGRPPGRCHDNPNRPPTVSTPTDPQHGKVWRIHKPSERKRAEFARTNGFIPRENGVYYIGWRWKITATRPIDKGIAVFQWKTDDGGNIGRNKQNYPFSLGYDGTNLTLNAYGPGSPDWRQGSSISNRKTTLWRGRVRQNQWVTLVFKVKVSHNANNGYIEFWFNGNRQTLRNADFKEYKARISGDGKRAYHKTNDGKEVYMKWGAYNENACYMDIKVYYDEMRVATTYEAAQPSGAQGPGPGLSGTYRLKNAAYGLYLDSDGTQLKIGTNNGSLDRQWALVPTADGYYNIDSKYQGRGVLDTDGNKVVVNSTIQPTDMPQATYDDKEWKPEHLGNNTYRFKNRQSGRGYLAATSDNKVEWTTWDGPRAQWVLERIGSNREEAINTNYHTSEVAIYPNPAHDKVYVAGNPNTMYQTKVLDLAGKEVLTNMGQTTEQGIQIGHLPAGSYLIQVIGSEGSTLHRFVKE